MNLVGHGVDALEQLPSAVDSPRSAKPCRAHRLRRIRGPGTIYARNQELTARLRAALASVGWDPLTCPDKNKSTMFSRPDRPRETSAASPQAVQSRVYPSSILLARGDGNLRLSVQFLKNHEDDIERLVTQTPSFTREVLRVRKTRTMRKPWRTSRGSGRWRSGMREAHAARFQARARALFGRAGDSTAAGPCWRTRGLGPIP